MQDYPINRFHRGKKEAGKTWPNNSAGEGQSYSRPKHDTNKMASTARQAPASSSPRPTRPQLKFRAGLWEPLLEGNLANGRGFGNCVQQVLFPTPFSLASFCCGGWKTSMHAL